MLAQRLSASQEQRAIIGESALRMKLALRSQLLQCLALTRNSSSHTRLEPRGFIGTIGTHRSLGVMKRIVVSINGLSCQLTRMEILPSALSVVISKIQSIYGIRPPVP